MEQFELPLEPRRRVYTVSELNAAIRELLEREFEDVWVAGEISGVRPAASGHIYFTLKDDESVIRCVIFRSGLRWLRFKPQDSMAVLARGRLDVWEPRGEYQLLVEYLEPRGVGALQVAFEQLKKKLAAEGLFDPARKRLLPRLPQRIGIVTSPTGAVIRDMLQILGRRFPGLHIRVFPALVQGQGSVQEICQGLEYFSSSPWAEVVVLARGGGSLEDLWSFNEEAVARAIASSTVPVVSAIGHETDVTIADFVADVRAPTPSAAAEIIVPTREEVRARIQELLDKAAQALRYRLAQAARALEQKGLARATAVLQRRLGRLHQRLDEMDYRLRERLRMTLDHHRKRFAEWETRLRRQDLRLRFSEGRNRLQQVQQTLGWRMRARLSQARSRWESLTAELTHLSPLRVLERGYAIVQDEGGRVLKDAADAPPGTPIQVRLARGRLQALVTESSSQ